ncbi:MAG TPA: prolyl oligopeptidase family serine peptidase [Anaerolineaceae bacterium]|nr:prolyl oligopeptidase family serine peptidase [Anaerolineaceae bacterium]
MPPHLQPLTKPELLRQLRAARAAFDITVNAVPPERFEETLPGGEWSTKDTLTHLTFYERQLAERLWEQLERRPHTVVDTDFMTWQEQNPIIRERHKDDPVEKTLQDSHAAFESLWNALSTLPEEELFRPQIWEGVPEPVFIPDVLHNDVTDHYPEHIENIRRLFPGLSERSSAMPPTKTNKPFGTWLSPITPELIGGSARFSDVQWAPGSDRLVWCGSLSGKASLLTQVGLDAPSELSAGFNPSGSIGYGGGEFCAGVGGAVFAEKDGRLYFAPYGPGSPQALTPAFGRCASPKLSPAQDRVLFVHSYEERDVLALVRLDGKSWPRVFASGADFYMQPTWSPDGKAAAWVEWDHPDMPWDGTRLMFAVLDESGGAPAEAHLLDGGPETPIFQPEFSPDGRYLAYLRNPGEWDQLVLFDLQTGEKRILLDGRSLLPPAWVQGSRVLAWAPESSALYFLENQQAKVYLRKVDIRSGESQAVDIGAFTNLEQLCVSASGALALIAQSPSLPARIIILQAGQMRIAARSRADDLHPEDLPQAQEVDWLSSDGARVFGTYYAPANRNFSAEGLPPMVVYIHGGPTSAARIGFDLDTAFFTSRGYAYLEVNYRGSTGFGRSYRDALRGNWGKLDLQDAVEGARAVVGMGLANPSRLIIKGGSAGGYTVLNALIHYPGFFKAGLCSYGVSNLFTLDMDTHKFEAHYNASLIGALPEAAQKYHDFSPIFHAHKIQDPLAIFQGADDKVVPQSQSDSIVEVLRANRVPYVYRIYPGEGHGFRKSESIIDYYNTIERFLLQQVIFSV